MAYRTQGEYRPVFMGTPPIHYGEAFRPSPEDPPTHREMYSNEDDFSAVPSVPPPDAMSPTRLSEDDSLPPRDSRTNQQLYDNQTGEMLTGVGLFLKRTVAGQVVVGSTVPNSASARSRAIRAGDELTHIDGQVITAGSSLDEARSRVMGPRGTEVTIGLRRPARPWNKNSLQNDGQGQEALAVGEATEYEVRLVRGNVGADASDVPSLSLIEKLQAEITQQRAHIVVLESQLGEAWQQSKLGGGGDQMWTRLEEQLSAKMHELRATEEREAEADSRRRDAQKRASELKHEVMTLRARLAQEQDAHAATRALLAQAARAPPAAARPQAPVPQADAEHEGSDADVRSAAKSEVLASGHRAIFAALRAQEAALSNVAEILPQLDMAHSTLLSSIAMDRSTLPSSRDPSVIRMRSTSPLPQLRYGSPKPHLRAASDAWRLRQSQDLSRSSPAAGDGAWPSSNANTPLRRSWGGARETYPGPGGDDRPSSGAERQALRHSQGTMSASNSQTPLGTMSVSNSQTPLGTMSVSNSQTPLRDSRDGLVHAANAGDPREFGGVEATRAGQGLSRSVSQTPLALRGLGTITPVSMRSSSPGTALRRRPATPSGPSIFSVFKSRSMSSVPTPPAGLGGRGEQAEALDFTDVPTGADGTPGGRSARGDALDPQSLGWAVGPAVSASEALARETDVAWEDTMRRAQEWEARNLHQGERAGWKSNPRTAWGGESKVELA